MNATVYRLFWDTSHLRGSDEDAVLVPFNDWEYTVAWSGTDPLEVPVTPLFEANFKVTKHSDYPCNDVNWPLMSSWMLEILHQVGDFPHRLIPVRLIDRRALGPGRYLPDGSLRPEVVDDRFVAVQLTTHLDVVDWDRSIFEKSNIGPIEHLSFDSIVLTTPSDGFPPLFRLPVKSSMLLVSAEARQALEAAGIRGVQFLDLPGTSQYKQD